MIDFLTEAERWTAVTSRDRRADGAFFFSVSTTGVYCRPSCGARRPNRENVRFHETAADAERAGFRACLRCKPDQLDRHAAIVAEACRRIEALGTAPSLMRLAARAGISPHHFLRVFKAATGVTPRAYAAELRNRRIASALHSEQSVTDAIHAAGFGSSSRFYSGAADVLGTTPSNYRNGGTSMQIRCGVAKSSLGTVLAARTEKGICAILVGDDVESLLADLRRRFPRAAIERDDETLAAQLSEVVALVETPSRGLQLPLDIQGTAFQRRVWETLRSIPAGSTATYGEIAASIGAPSAARAVAGACAANPLAIAVPCHRVVRSDGDLSGYRWGTPRKRELLAREQQSKSS